MPKLTSRHSFTALAAVAFLTGLGTPNRANAEDKKNGAASAITNGVSLLKRLLHLGPEEDVVSHAISVSSREATLELELADGKTRILSLRGGRLYVDAQPVGNYAPGGTLDRAWRRALADGASLDTRALLISLRSWRGATLTGEELTAKARIDDALRGLNARVAPAAPAAASAPAARARAEAETQLSQSVLRLEDLAALDSVAHQLQALREAGTDIELSVGSAPVHIGDITIGAGQRHDGNLVVYKGAADIFGEVTGDVVSLFGDVVLHRGSIVGRNAVSVGGTVNDQGGRVRGDIRIVSRADLVEVHEQEHGADEADHQHVMAAPERARSAVDTVFDDVRNVVAVFVALAMLGFGTVFFGRRYIEVVADTASHSFGRSFVVGLLGQLLILPTFAMLIVGLICTVVGILVLPFAAIAFVAAAILAAVGGYLAVAHSIGETFTRRRMAHGAFVRAPNAYGYLFAGLVGLLGLWAAAALTAWMGPVVLVFKVAAVIVTWIAVTTGFGAVLLSRAGLRETFAGRQFGEMSDEYLWATPPATPTAARMKMEQK